MPNLWFLLFLGLVASMQVLLLLFLLLFFLVYWDHFECSCTGLPF
uniref:E5 protein n=1 Tax=Bovine papillomavirus type 1 TaxID=337052 RepID=R4UBI1_BPV1|nr:E5 protein [Deltapapillomavirus 4]ANA51937.1 E5 protein [Deltapapillomavirus 4]ANO81549.1 major oncoprotein [Deltapapillomavirus 4]